MMLLIAAAAIIVAFLFGGSLKNIERCPVRALALPIVSLLLTSGGGYLCQAVLPREPYFIIMLCAGYLLALMFIFLNRRLIWFSAPAGLGTLLNLAVIAANGFYMPVLAQPGVTIPPELSASYILADSSTRLLFLGDVIYLPFPRGFASAGDILLSLGAAFLIFYLLRPRFWRAAVK